MANRYVYDSHMRGTGEAPHEPELRILQATCRRLSRWNHDDLAAPWWRLYWNPTPGARLLHGGAALPLAPDRVALIPPNTPYAARTDGPVEHFFVHFMLGRDFRLPPRVYLFPADSQASNRARDAAAEERRGPGAVLALRSHVTGVLARVPPQDWLEPVRDPRLRRALRAMERSPAAPPSNSELARVASLSTNGFVRLFRQKMGLPPQTFQMNRRIERACAALVNTDRSVDTIATANGFCDRAHLTRMFKKYVYNTPGAYRREHRLA